MLVGRGTELDRIDSLLIGAQRGATGSTVFTGEPGIGKTALIREAGRRASHAGMVVVELVCVESEKDLPGAALATLASRLPVGTAGLDTPYRAAIGGLTSARPTGSDHLTLAAALLQALTVESASRPLALLLDDVHWMDEVSAVALAFAIRRVTDDPLAVVAAARSGHTSPLLSAGLDVVELQGIDPPSAAILARDIDSSISASVASHLAVATGGNPMWLAEAILKLTPSQKAAAEPMGVPSPPSEGLHQVLVARLQGLSAPARQAALVLAAGQGAAADEIRLALAEDGLDVEELEAAGVVDLVDRTWRFAHPLLRSVAYHEAVPSARRRAHRNLAATCRDVVRSAWHLDRSAAGPDRETADRLEEAAWLMRARFGPGPAAAAFERSAVLTPSDQDPDRYRRMGEAGIGYVAIGRYEHALSLCEEALAEAPALMNPSLRSRIVKAKLSVQFWSGHPEEAIRVATSEAAELAVVDPAAPFDILMLTAFFHCTSGHPAEATRIAERLVDVAVTPRQRLLANLTLDHMTIVYGRGPTAPAATEWRNQLVAEGPGSDFGYLELTQLLVPEIWCGELERCWERVLSVEASMRNYGNMLGLTYMLGGQADLAWRLGRYQEAEALAYQAEELGELIGDPLGPMMAWPALIKLAAVKGDEAGAQDRLKRLGFPGGRTPVRSADVFVEHAAGMVALTFGQFGTAVRLFRAAGEAAAESGYRSPGFVPWRADLAEALARVGNRLEAREQAETLLAEARQSRVVAAEAAARTVFGMVAASESEAEESFGIALDLYEQVKAPFEHARALLSYGERLRRARRRSGARDPLRRAIALFDSLPAPVWAGRARAELAATGETRAQPTLGGGRLTPQELQVANLLARPGTTVREAATKLFLSPKTVEVHLGRVYRKLGVSDRKGLRQAMSPNPDTDD